MTGPDPCEEKCERCGWPLMLIDLLAYARALAGLDEADCTTPNPGAAWCEIHQRGIGGTVVLTLVQHDPDRCARHRAGEPLTPDGNPDDDGWD